MCVFFFFFLRYQDGWNKNHFQLVSAFVQLLFVPFDLSSSHEIEADDNSFPIANSLVSNESRFCPTSVFTSCPEVVVGGVLFYSFELLTVFLIYLEDEGITVLQGHSWGSINKCLSS